MKKLRKILAILSHITLALLIVLAIAYHYRTDPIQLLSGKRLTGEEVAYPDSWDFTKDVELVYVETRSESEPHSVTTACFLYQGEFYIPAYLASTKDWTAYARVDPRARIKVGDVVYKVNLNYEAGMDPGLIREILSPKYPHFERGVPEDVVDLWAFRVTERI